jgi:hypothetical protein
MLTDATFFILTFVTLITLAWSGYELLRVKEDPLGDHLEELRAHAMATKSTVDSRRRGGGGFGIRCSIASASCPGAIRGWPTPRRN